MSLYYFQYDSELWKEFDLLFLTFLNWKYAHVEKGTKGTKQKYIVP